MLNFLCFFILFNAVKTDPKLALHHMGKIFIIELTKIKCKMLHILKVFLPQKIRDGLPVFVQKTIYHVRTEMR